MRFAFGARVQAALVIVLFLGSLAALVFNSVTAFVLPGRELAVREEVEAAANQLAEKAAPVLAAFAGFEGNAPSLDLQRGLSQVAEEVLAARPGVEGGFFLAGEPGQFTGTAFPTDPHRPLHPPPPRRDPPPLETPYIRQQVRDCLMRAPGEAPLVQALDVGPSRVVVATAPVGDARPALAAVWVMVRLTGPEEQHAQMLRYQVSTALALAGVLLALVLTASLTRTLRRERERRERLSDELRRAEHLASLGRLLAGVAHEVRNPLAGIRSTVQLWQRLPDQACTPASMEAMLQAVDRLNGLVSRLLYFARTGWDEPRPVDVNAVVRETLELVRAQAEGQGVRLEADLAPTLPTTSGSAPALQQVVLNLAANALQAMPHGGRLRLQTRAVEGPLPVELLVTDTGAGVSAQARPHLFEPFFTTRPEGTGLGLALCREIVRQHGGSIDLEEGGAAGAVFRVLLRVEGPAADVLKGRPS
jgi:two-component system sensor histidine kinase HydH